LGYEVSISHLPNVVDSDNNLMMPTAACQIVAMSIIVHVWRRWDYPAFENANLSAHPVIILTDLIVLMRFSGASFFINLSSWILDVLISILVAITGLAANSGHAWAAGGRAYRPIPEYSG
jgi:hypothetical protein